MIKTLGSMRSVRELFAEYGVLDLDFVSMHVGYDGKAYFLFSSGIPPRIDGMFVEEAVEGGHHLTCDLVQTGGRDTQIVLWARHLEVVEE